MRQKESFFLISIKRPRASLRGGGADLSQALRIYANVVTCVSCVSCVVGVVPEMNFFHLIGTCAR